MHRRKSNGEPFYIGVGKQESRAFSKASRNKHWHNIVNSDGYEVEILQRDLSYEMALTQEKLLILEIGRHDLGKGPLVNYNDGGLGGSNPNQETREKKSQYMKNRVVSEKTKLKISLAMMSRKITEETKKKRSTSLKGNKNMKTNFTQSTCSVCNKTGQTSAMRRWHFENCKDAERKEKKRLMELAKQQKSNKGYKHPQEVLDKIRKTKEQNGTLHRKPTEQQIQKGLQTKLEKGNYYPTQETKNKVSESLKGLVQSRVQCIHCNKVGGVNGMKRYHFDNCKYKLQK